MNKIFKIKRGFILSKVEGFSLLETVVYISILALMLGVIMNVAVPVVRSHRAVKASKSVENSAIVSIERLTRELRWADSIDLPSSVFDSNPGSLVLAGTDADGGPRTVEFYLDSGAILIKENGLDLGQLSQPEAKVTNLVFHLFSNTNTQGVRTDLTVESGTSTHYKSGNFYSSAILR